MRQPSHIKEAQQDLQGCSCGLLAKCTRCHKMDLDFSRLHKCATLKIQSPDMCHPVYKLCLFNSPNIFILSIFTNLVCVKKKLPWKIAILLWPCETFLFEQMAKHVGLIPSLDGGLYQVNGDKVEVSAKKGLMRMDSY